MDVARDAAPDEIKRSYRRLARKFHPDASEEPDAEERFKEVQEACEVLKDPEKRAAHDRFGADWKAGQECRPPPDWEQEVGFAGGGYTDAGEFSDFFESLFGGAGHRRERRGHTHLRRKGEDIHAKVEIPLEEAFAGATRRLSLELPEVDESGHLVARRHTLNVRIPKGVTQGQRIRLGGQGEPGLGGAPPGDLYLEVVHARHPYFHAEGRDVYLDLPVAPWEAALGETVAAPTPRGDVDLKVPPDSGAGTRLRTVRHVFQPLARMRSVGVAAIVGLVLLAPVPALAQEPGPGEPGAPAPLSESRIEALVETLRNDAAREELILALEALVEAERVRAGEAPESEQPGFGLTAFSFLSKKVEAIGALATGAVRFASDLPELGRRLASAAADPGLRERSLEFLLKLVLIVGAGFLVEWLVVRLLAQPRFELREREGDSAWLRALFLLERTLLDLAPVGAFGVAAYATLALAAPSPETRVVALIIVNANLLVRAVTVVSRMVLRPRYSTIRLLRLADDTANYLFFWVRRLAVVSVYGYFIADALLLLGTGREAHAFARQLAGLVVAAMAVMFVLQNRVPVRSWLAGAEPRSSGAWGRVRASLSVIWHVIAVAYVVAVHAVWALELAGGFEYLVHGTVVTAITLVVTFGAVTGLGKAVERGFRLNEETRRRFPSLEERVNRNRGFLETGLRSIVGLVAALVVLDAWGVGPFAWLSSETGRAVVGHIVTIILVAGGALVAWELLSTLVERYLEERDEDGEIVSRGARIRTFLPLLRNVVRIVLLVLVVLIVLSEMGVNIGPLLAGAGIIGLAVSFGAQSLVKDVITGFFILLEDTMSVGDVVDVGGHIGLVEGMTIRSVRLRDLEGIVHTVPFGEVASVRNMTKDFSYAFMEVGVAYRENVDDVVRVLCEIGEGMQADEEFGPLILEPLEVLGLDSFGASSVNIRVRLKTLPIKQWAVRREFQRRMKRVFDERGIEIPFPHQTVYFGTDKTGHAAAARIALERAAGEEPDLARSEGSDALEEAFGGTRTGADAKTGAVEPDADRREPRMAPGQSVRKEE